MAFKFLGQRQLGKLPSRWVSTILMVAIGGTAVIPPRSNARDPRGYDKEMYKCRNLVERFFNRMKQFRRFATRYDKTAKSFLALVHFLAVFVWLAIS